MNSGTFGFWNAVVIGTLALGSQVRAGEVKMEPADARAARGFDSRVLDPKDQSAVVAISSVSQQGSVLTVSGQFGGRSFLGQTRLSKASAVVELEVELFEEDHGACGDYRRESATLRLRRTATGEARILRAELTVEATSDRCHLDGWKESVVLTPANDELCRQSLTDHLGFNVYTLDPETREPVVGFSGVQGYGVWGQDLNASLVMRTATAKFYYTLPCDICADLLRCDLENGEIRSLFSGHSASCGDLPEAERKVATYLNCN